MFKHKIVSLIPVMLWLEWLALADTDVIGLLVGSTVKFAPRAGKCRDATFSFKSLGRRYTLFSYFLLVFQLSNKSSWARAWLVKEQDITKDGWPVAHPKFNKRPLAK